MEFDNSWNAILRPGAGTLFFDSVRSLPFQPGAKGYHPVNAYWLAEMCRLVYRRGTEEIGEQAPSLSRRDILKQVGLEEYCFLHRGNIYCSIIRTANGADNPFSVVVFRGTTGFDCWLSNLNTLQVQWPNGGMVHCGFKKEFYALWGELNECLEAIREPVFYTGHSLGAALATMLASLRPPRAVYTFGSPRVGDAAFGRTLQELPIYRIANSRDVVINVPIPRIPFDYRHVGELHLFPRNGDPFPCPEMDEEAAAADDPGDENGNGHNGNGSFKRRLIGPPDFLYYHAPVNYAAYLAREIGGGSMPASQQQASVQGFH